MSNEEQTSQTPDSGGEADKVEEQEEGAEKERDRAPIKTIIDSALYVVRNYISKEPDTIVSIENLDDRWVAIVEVVERKAIPDTQDIMGRYEITLGPKGDLLGWEQKMVRKRSDPIGREE